jgi:hypothetical protein
MRRRSLPAPSDPSDASRHQHRSSTSRHSRRDQDEEGYTSNEGGGDSTGSEREFIPPAVRRVVKQIVDREFRRQQHERDLFVQRCVHYLSLFLLACLSLYVLIRIAMT